MSEASRRLLNVSDGPTPSDTLSPRTKSIDRTFLKPFTKLQKKHSISALRLDEIKFQNIPTVEVQEDDDDNGCDLEEIRKELRAIPAIRRKSISTPPSPIPRHSPFLLRKPHMPHLPHLPLPHLPAWKDIKGRWGSGIVFRGNEVNFITHNNYSYKVIDECFKNYYYCTTF